MPSGKSLPRRTEEVFKMSRRTMPRDGNRDNRRGEQGYGNVYISDLALSDGKDNRSRRSQLKQKSDYEKYHIRKAGSPKKSQDCQCEDYGCRVSGITEKAQGCGSVNEPLCEVCAAVCESGPAHKPGGCRGVEETGWRSQQHQSACTAGQCRRICESGIRTDDAETPGRTDNKPLVR